jgi:predicted acetyltransferase
MLELVTPAAEHLPEYVAALKKDWSPDNFRTREAGLEELEKIERDPALFLAQMTDLEAKAGPVTLPDGSLVPRLPGYRRWMWDGEFCGQIGFRWQPGTSNLPATCAGHIGYSVVPWKRRRGYATQALRLLLAQIDIPGLDYVTITADTDNIPSQKVILSNGGVLVEKFERPASHGRGPSYRYRVDLRRV